MRRRRLRPVPLTGRPTVSVVIPCYNYGRYLPDAVESVLLQQDVEVEVIVVDDCSTDGSQLVAQQLATADDRISLVLHEQNQGHIRTYNDGLSRVTGNHVVLLSADDLLAPGALARASAVLEALPEVGLVYGYAADFESTPPRARVEPESWTVWSGASWLRRICRRGTNIIVNPEAMMRASLMRELVGYNADMPHAADMDLWMRAAAVADVARVNGVDQAFYRVHQSNMHTTTFAGLLTDAVERHKVFLDFFSSSPDTWPQNDPGLRRLASRSLAVEALRCACIAEDRGGQLGGARAAEYADFAVAACPPVVRSPQWIAYRKRAGRPAGRAHRVVTSQVYALRWKLRWRRWRRFGT